MLALGALGLTCDNDATGRDEGANATVQEPAATTSGAAVAGEAADVPSATRYPGLQLGRLDPEDRTVLVDIAQGELCPCEGQEAMSLDECLQKTDEAGRCPLALMSGAAIGEGLQQGLTKADVMTRLAEYLENARKVHTFTLEGVPRKGPADAPVILVEFADFECPHCREASKILAKIAKERGDVAFYFKNYPLPFHPNAQVAAQAAQAAHAQDQFWPMHDLLFTYQSELSGQRIKALAGQLGLNMDRFTTDIRSPTLVGAVQRDRTEGERAGISGTPALFINGRKYLGEMTEEKIVEAIGHAKEERAAAAGSSE